MTMPALELPELIAFSEMGDLSSYDVVRYGYRKARVIGDDVINGPFSYSMADEYDRLQHRLAAAAASEVDNHECYLVTKAGQRLYLWFYDWKVMVGTAIRSY